MTDNVKPVPCGCGGEARTGKIYGDAWTVECTECGMQSGCYDTEAEAITAWNRAMSGVAKNATTERTERKKGKWEVQPSTGGDRPFIWWKCSECGYVIYSETERDRREFHAFCGRCGAEMMNEDGYMKLEGTEHE